MLCIYHGHLGREELGWLSIQRGLNDEDRNKNKERPIICATVHRKTMSLLQAWSKQSLLGSQAPYETEISKRYMIFRRKKLQGFRNRKNWSQKSITPLGNSRYLNILYLRPVNLFSHRELCGLGLYRKTLGQQLCLHASICIYVYAQIF